MNFKMVFTPDMALIALNLCATAFSDGDDCRRVNLLNISRTVIGWTNNTGCGSKGKKLFSCLPRCRKSPQQSTLLPAHKKTRTILFSTPLEYEDSRNGVRSNKSRGDPNTALRARSLPCEVYLRPEVVNADIEGEQRIERDVSYRHRSEYQ